MALISLNNLERFFNNLKTYISNALNSKANMSHTHTTADISNLAENWNVTGTNLDISFAGSSNNNGQLSIQINGTDITTFMANQITNSTFNLNFNSFGYNLIPSANETYNLGSATNNYNTVYARNINHGLSSSSLILSGGNGASNGSNLVLYGIDRTDGFQGIWQLTARGTNSYYLRGNADGSITTSATSIRPTTDLGCDLGSSNYYWNNGYINNLYTKVRGVTAPYLACVPMDYTFGTIPNEKKTGFINLFTDANGVPNFRIYNYIRTTGDQAFYFYTYSIKDETNAFILSQSYSDNLLSVSAVYGNLGSSQARWWNLFLVNAPNVSSDERVKQQIKSVDDDLIEIWENVKPKQYKLNSSVERKGENARTHIGYIVQDIQKACEEKGIDPTKYSMFCHDEWEEQEEKKDENGQVIEPYRAKGDLYSLRYEEALVVECAYLRKQIELLQERLNKLEEK